MQEYNEKFEYGFDGDAEDEDSISIEAFLKGYYSDDYEEYLTEHETKHLITQVFTEECSAMELKEAVEKLTALIKNEPKKRRALGSLGCSVKSGFLRYDEKTKLFIKQW